MFSKKVFIYLVDNEIFTTFVVEIIIGKRRAYSLSFHPRNATLDIRRRRLLAHTIQGVGISSFQHFRIGVAITSRVDVVYEHVSRLFFEKFLNYYIDVKQYEKESY